MKTRTDIKLKSITDKSVLRTSGDDAIYMLDVISQIQNDPDFEDMTFKVIKDKYHSLEIFSEKHDLREIFLSGTSRRGSLDWILQIVKDHEIKQREITDRRNIALEKASEVLTEEEWHLISGYNPFQHKRK